MTDNKDDLIAEAITEAFGERCPDFNPECWCCKAWAQYDEAAARITELERQLIDVTASLVAAISLLERGGKAAKKASASDKMFDQMLKDYEASVERARATLNKEPESKEET